MPAAMAAVTAAGMTIVMVVVPVVIIAPAVGIVSDVSRASVIIAIVISGISRAAHVDAHPCTTCEQ